MRKSENLDRDTFEKLSRSNLGFQFVILFGSSKVTPAVKQLTVYFGCYIQKALDDAKEIGRKNSIKNYSDALMKMKHKEAKLGNYCYSGGKSGPITKTEYQQNLIQQQFLNEWLRIENKCQHQKQVNLKLEFEENLDNDRHEVLILIFLSKK